MENRFERSEALIGKDGQQKLNNSHVAVFGLGGVGSYAVESLVRAGIGSITLIDNDVYSVSNLNRQLYATVNTIGKAKTEVAKARVLEINPNANVTLFNVFVLDNANDGIDFSKFDYVIDAIDTVSGKLSIIKRAKENNVPVISCMSAGNKLDATCFKVEYLSKTKVCPLCKVMRKLCKDNNLGDIKVVYSEEQPATVTQTELVNGRPAPASISFVPSVMGLIASGEVIKCIVGAYNE